MALAHLTVAGVVEFALTAGVVAYLQRANLPLLRHQPPTRPTPKPRPAPRRASAGAGRRSGSRVMLALTPLGLLAPGGAFGEDAPGDLDLREVPPRRGAERSAPLRRVLAPRVVRRLRLQQRQASRARLPGLGVRRASPSIAIVGSVLVGWRSRRRAGAAAGRARRRDRGRDRDARVAPAPEVGLCPCGCIGKRRKGSFVEKTLGGAAPTAAPGDVLRRRRDASRAAAARRPAGEAVIGCSGCSSPPRSCATSRCSLGLYVATPRARGRVAALAVVLRQAGLAVRPDLHRHRRAPRDAERHHARRHRRAARHVVRASRSASRARA